MRPSLLLPLHPHTRKHKKNLAVRLQRGGAVRGSVHAGVHWGQILTACHSPDACNTHRCHSDIHVSKQSQLDSLNWLQDLAQIPLLEGKVWPEIDMAFIRTKVLQAEKADLKGLRDGKFSSSLATVTDDEALATLVVQSLRCAVTANIMTCNRLQLNTMR